MINSNPSYSPSRADYEDLFPAKLHYVLEQAEKEGHGAVIAWQPHGRAFLVNDRERFVHDFLPNWFRQKKWTSFQRQLNLYDFKRMTTGLDRNAYYHPCFVKGERGLCRHIGRAKRKGTGPRRPSCKPEEQPNFYRKALDDDAGAACVDAGVLSWAARRSAAAPGVDGSRGLPDESLPPGSGPDRSPFGAAAPLAIPSPMVRSASAPFPAQALPLLLTGLGVGQRAAHQDGMNAGRGHCRLGLSLLPAPLPWPPACLASSPVSSAYGTIAGAAEGSPQTYGLPHAPPPKGAQPTVLIK